MILFRTELSDIVRFSAKDTAGRDNSITGSSPPPHSGAPGIVSPSTALHSRQRQEPIWGMRAVLAPPTPPENAAISLLEANVPQARRTRLSLP